MRRATRAAVLGALAASLVMAGCASTPDGPVHAVRPGENLYRLSRYYGVPVQAIRRANDIQDVTQIRVGRLLVIPGATRPPPSASLAYFPEPGVAVGSRDADQRARARRESDLDFVWPVHGRLSSGFGWRSGRHHDGIDIPARPGTPVHAAEAGRVIHSGRGLGDYGNVVIIKHAGNYTTVYAHNRRNRVAKGEFVERGEVIAEVGKTGNASGNHLHFEVRRLRSPEDPMRYLP